jgi:hypothetical protein
LMERVWFRWRVTRPLIIASDIERPQIELRGVSRLLSRRAIRQAARPREVKGDHVQYKTLTLSQKSENEEEQFDFSESNGYTAKIDATSGPAEE